MTNRQQNKILLCLLLTPALLWLGLLIVLPHLDMLLLSFSKRVATGEYKPALAQYATFFEEPLYWHTFMRTASMSALATAITLVLAFPVSWYIAKIARARSKAITLAAILLPFWSGEMVRTLGWVILLRSHGVIPQFLFSIGLISEPVELLYNDASIMLGLVYASLLFMVIPLTNALETLDDSLIEAAYDLGGKPANILFHIVLPHAAPGVAAGTIMVFMLSLGNYLTPVLLGGKNSMWFTEQIYTQFITRFNWEQGAAFAFLLLSLSSLMVWAGLKLSGQSFANTMRRV
ncbi:ABC transporter permease [Undibacterium sp. Ji50W]|uniref:ABC transporter permease n=1 Tax=Undibacterium sp. Ji50W TaxID=3413041 RepID=UPI003BF1B586